MVPFLRKFFPSILEKSEDANTNMYCVYNSQSLTAFTSSLYIAGLAASLMASRVTAKFGRTFTMVLGGCTFLLGAAVSGAAQNIAMLIIGRILLGFGVGFTNQSVGFGSHSALIAAIILGVVNLGSILVSTFLVDRFGRRFLFLEGGVQMFIFQIAVGGVLAATTGLSGTEHMSKGNTVLVLVLMCIYAAGFGWSWGPLSWLVPSEIFPLNVRPTGQSISIAVNFASTFVLSQTFLSMLCCFKFGSFFFYAGWIAIMTIFVSFFVPETKGIPLDSMHTVWNKHWYWHKFVKEEP